MLKLRIDKNRWRWRLSPAAVVQLAEKGEVISSHALSEECFSLRILLGAKNRVLFCEKGLELHLKRELFQDLQQNETLQHEGVLVEMLKGEDTGKGGREEVEQVIQIDQKTCPPKC